jgi:hypothetical protein
LIVAFNSLGLDQINVLGSSSSPSYLLFLDMLTQLSPICQLFVLNTLHLLAKGTIMKTLREYIELVENMSESSNTRVTNKDGTSKLFNKWASKDEIEAWRNSSPKAEKSAQRGAQRTSSKASNAEARKAKLSELYWLIVGAAGDTFPDGDAIDSPKVQRYLQNHGLDMDDVDAAFRAQGGTNYHEYMADFYDQMSSDNPDTFDRDDNPWKPV